MLPWIVLLVTCVCLQPNSIEAAAGSKSNVDKAVDYPPLEIGIHLGSDVGEIRGVYQFQRIHKGAPYYHRDTSGDPDAYAQLAAHLYRTEQQGSWMWMLGDELDANSVRGYALQTVDSKMPPGADGEGAKDWLIYDGKEWVGGEVDMKPAQLVTCGSSIKLTMAGSSSYYLHAFPDINFQNSNLAVVAGKVDWSRVNNNQVPKTELAESYFVLKAAEGDVSTWGETCGYQGQPIKSGDIIRFYHPSSQSWLHSGWHAGHMYKSRSGQAQVSLNKIEDDKYTHRRPTDSGDNWIISVVGNSGHWVKGGAVQVKHHNSGRVLTMLTSVYHDRNNLDGAREVVAAEGRVGGGLTNWITAEGLYFRSRDENIEDKPHGSTSSRDEL